jgi:hypothetical protein
LPELAMYAAAPDFEQSVKIEILLAASAYLPETFVLIPCRRLDASLNPLLNSP